MLNGRILIILDGNKLPRSNVLVIRTLDYQSRAPKLKTTGDYMLGSILNPSEVNEMSASNF